jgi:hypothetical protein
MRSVLTAACAFAVSFAIAFPAAAASREAVIGFGDDADIIAVVVDDDVLGRFVRLCRADASALPSAWPPALKVDDGVACATLQDTDAGGPAEAFAKDLTKANKPGKAAPFGLKVGLVVEGEGKSHVVTISSGDDKAGGRTIRLPAVTSDVPLKVKESLWHPKGTLGAVVLDGGKTSSAVVVVDTRELLKGGPAGQKRAVTLLKDAEALLKKKAWSDASAILDEAIAADDKNAAVRYARAAAEAQSGVGRTAMLEQLGWLKTASATDGPQKDAAKKLLDGAQKDKAFDAWVGEPEVRELIGLPALSSMTAEARLLERSATWTKQGSTCKAPWLTLTFSKAGKGSLEIQESCRGKKTKAKQPFTWTPKEGVVVTWKTAAKEVSDVAIPADGTLELDGSYQQLRLSKDGVSAIGPFEPGMATLD